MLVENSQLLRRLPHPHDRVRIVPGRDDQLAEGAPERPHFIDLRNPIAVGGEADARGRGRSRKEVDVVPGPARGVHRRIERIVRARGPERMARHVPAERRLERRSAVAEHVIGDAEPRPDVLPVRHVRDLRVAARSDESPARVVLRLDLGVQVVVADAGVDGEAIQRPGVLGVEAHVRHQLFLDVVRRRSDRHRLRRAAAHRDGHVMGGPEVDVLRALNKIEPELHVVRARDVSQRTLVRAHRRVVLREVAAVGAEVHTGVRLGDRDHERRRHAVRPDRRVADRFARPGLAGVAEPEVEQHLARERRLERDGLEVVAVDHLQVRGFGLPRVADNPMVGFARRETVVRRQLVLLRDLPGEPQVVAGIGLRVGAWP